MAYSIAGWINDAPSKRRSITGPDDVADECKDLRPSDREFFVALLLNARHHLIKRVVISIGSLNASIVHPREVFKPAIMAKCASIIIVHNHPSGDNQPSEEDISITNRLVKCGDLLGIGVLDHVIIANRRTFSFRTANMI
jgi:DNA repair protein RadC